MTRFLLLIILVSCATLSAQTIQWEKSFGGLGIETTFEIVDAPDGGYLVASVTNSNNNDVSGNHGASDIWLLKLNSAGEKQWQTCLGGLNAESVSSMVQPGTGGYILAGNTASNGLKSSSQVFGNHGDQDIWVVKVAEDGQIEWRQCYGGCDRDEVRSIHQTPDGNFCLVGGTLTFNTGDVYGAHGNWDAWIVKIAPDGALLWQKTLGGSGIDYFYDLKDAGNGDLFVSGLTSSTNGDLFGNDNKGVEDCWITKLSSNGDLLWSKTYGGEAYDGARSMSIGSQGNILVAGVTSSFGGDVAGNHGGSDFWVISLDSDGELLWERAFGGSENDAAFAIIPGASDNFIVVGETGSYDGDVSGNHGGRDAWIVKFDNNGNLKSQTCLGGTNDDFARSGIPGTGNALLIGGTAGSSDGDVSQNFGMTDAWIVKLDLVSGLKPVGAIPGGYELTVAPNPANDLVTISSNVSGPKQVEVFDMGGKLMQTFQMNDNTTTLYISKLAAGTYSIKISTRDGLIMSTNFVKN